MSQFNELLNELETLAKAQPAEGDDKIVAAAAEGGGQGEGEGDGDGNDVGTDGGDDGDEVLGKSFEVTLGDGTKSQAFDATLLIKSMQDQIGKLEGNENTMLKALSAATELIKSQGASIAKLTAKVTELGNAGRGRKAAVTVTEKTDPTLVKSQEAPGLTGEEFMAKALDAQKLGRLSGLDVAVAESCLNRGEAVPANIITKVLGPKA